MKKIIKFIGRILILVTTPVWFFPYMLWWLLWEE